MFSDLLFVHSPRETAEVRRPSEWRRLARFAHRHGYARVITLPDNGRGDLTFPAPGLLIGPGVTTSPPRSKETTA